MRSWARHQRRIAATANHPKPIAPARTRIVPTTGPTKKNPPSTSRNHASSASVSSTPMRSEISRSGESSGPSTSGESLGTKIAFLSNRLWMTLLLDGRTAGPVSAELRRGMPANRHVTVAAFPHASSAESGPHRPYRVICHVIMRPDSRDHEARFLLVTTPGLSDGHARSRRHTKPLRSRAGIPLRSSPVTGAVALRRGNGSFA